MIRTVLRIARSFNLLSVSDLAVKEARVRARGFRSSLCAQEIALKRHETPLKGERMTAGFYKETMQPRRWAARVPMGTCALVTSAAVMTLWGLYKGIISTGECEPSPCMRRLDAQFRADLTAILEDLLRLFEKEAESEEFDADVKKIEALFYSVKECRIQIKEGYTFVHFLADTWISNNSEISDLSDRVLHFILRSNPEFADVADVLGRTPLELAIKNGRLNLLKCLMRNGASVAEAMSDRKSALQLALEVGNFDIVRALLQRHKNNKALYDGGKNILHFAVESYNQCKDQERKDEVLNFIAELLDECGLLLFMEDSHLETPLALAVRYGQGEVVKLLKASGAADKSRKDLSQIMSQKNGSFDLVKRYYIYADKDVLYEDNRNIFHYLATRIDSKNKEEVQAADKIAQELLACQEIDINAPCSDGSTPLHLAAKHGRPSLMEILIKQGARIDVKNRAGNTPLHMAVLSDGGDNEESTRLREVLILLKEGADPDIRNHANRLPFDQEWISLKRRDHLRHGLAKSVFSKVNYPQIRHCSLVDLARKMRDKTISQASARQIFKQWEDDLMRFCKKEPKNLRCDHVL